MAKPKGIAACKLVSLVWFRVLPPKYGGQKAVAFFNQHLAQHAPLLCLCASANQQIDRPYRIDNRLPNGRSSVLNPFAWLVIFQTVKREGATHLILEFPYYGIAGWLCQKLLGVKLIVRSHNIEYRRFREAGKWWWRALFVLEDWTLRHADMVFVKTVAELEIATRIFRLPSHKISVLPVGVEEQAIMNKSAAIGEVQKRHHLLPDEKILLFAGTLDYGPNADAVSALAQNLVPLLTEAGLPYRIIVCGRIQKKEFHHVKDAENDHLLVLGEVEDVETYFAAADVFLNPVQTGGGVQTKSLDALSYQLNVVCFQSRTAGIFGAGNKISAVPDGDWEAFSAAVLRAVNFTQPTPVAFFEAHNWRSIAAKAYQKILTC